MAVLKGFRGIGWLTATLLACGSTVWAVAPDPVEMRQPAPGQLIKTDQDKYEVKPSPYLNGKKFQCTVTQGTTVWKSAEELYPITTMTRADLSRFKTGPAEASCQVFYRGAWLPPGKVAFEFAGQGPANTAADDKPLTGPGQTFTLRAAGSPKGAPTLKISVAVGSGGWRIIHPENQVTDSSVLFHHTNELGQAATLTVLPCAIGKSAECLNLGLRDFSCGEGYADSKVEPVNENRAVCSSQFTVNEINKHQAKEDRKRTDRGLFKVGVAEYDPNTKLVAVCAASVKDNPAPLALVRRLCESMKLVK